LASPQHKQKYQNPKVSDMATPGHRMTRVVYKSGQ
jgi:hypothetical protein